MDETAQTSCTAFQGDRRIASGTLLHVAMKVKATFDRGEHAPILVFEDTTSRQVEIDLRGTIEQVAARLTVGDTPRAAHEASGDVAPRGPGRPKLGVIAREVTLLPRHWDWLGAQPGGASVALRKLVEEAKRANLGRDRVRQAQDCAYQFMLAMAGDRPGFEEATRALFAADARRFEEYIGAWPEDIRTHAKRLASAAFDA
jgi:uncharacterized protein